MELFNRETPYGVVMVLSGLIVLGCSAMVFFGLSGMYLGKLLLPVILVIISVLVIMYSLLKMCKYKQTHSLKSGWMRELLWGCVIFAIMMCGATPISNVVGALNDKGKFQENVDSIVRDVESLPLLYRDYVDERVERYQSHLMSLNEWESEYVQMLQGVGGSTQRAKAIYVCNSLTRKLITADMDSVEKVRSEWLHSLTDINAFSQRTIYNIASAGIEWMNEYKNLSSITYYGEETEPFDSPELRKKLTKMGGYVDFSKPSLLGVLIVCVAFVLVILPYIMIRRSKRSKSGTHG